MSEKEEWIKQCVASGKSAEACELEYAQKNAGDSAPRVAGDAELLRKIEMLEAQLGTREKQLRQAIDIANRAKDEKQAKEEAEKLRLIDSIMIDGKFGKDELKTKSLSELQIIRTTLDKSLEKTFAAVSAEIDEARRAKQPQLTAGFYVGKDANGHDIWKGGL